MVVVGAALAAVGDGFCMFLSSYQRAVTIPKHVHRPRSPPCFNPFVIVLFAGNKERTEGREETGREDWQRGE